MCVNNVSDLTPTRFGMTVEFNFTLMSTIPYSSIVIDIDEAMSGEFVILPGDSRV